MFFFRLQRTALRSTIGLDERRHWAHLKMPHTCVLVSLYCLYTYLYDIAFMCVCAHKRASVCNTFNHMNVRQTFFSQCSYYYFPSYNFSNAYHSFYALAVFSSYNFVPVVRICIVIFILCIDVYLLWFYLAARLTFNNNVTGM